jgi:aldose 1-epimerase
MENSLHKSTLTFHCNRIQQNGWEEIILFDEATGAKATIIPSAGGILNVFETNHQGRSINIIDGFIDAEDWKKNVNNGHKGSKLSPYVCRLYNSTYHWEGQDYTTEGFKLNGHAIHGLLHAVPHEVMIAEASAFMAECKLLYRYKGTDSGYPFAFDMNIRYRLEAGSRLTIITTVHNRSGRTIPMADGWHPYFKLGESIDTATLQINSTKQVEFNELLIPTGKIINNNKWFKGYSLKDVSLDNCFELMPDEPLPHCTLSDPALGVALYIYPDRSYPYLQVYTPPHRKSIAIENLSSAPDAFNNKMGLIELGPEDSKGFTTRLRIATIEQSEKKKNFWQKCLVKLNGDFEVK